MTDRPLRPQPSTLAQVGLTPALVTAWTEHIEPHGQEVLWKDIPWRRNIWDAILEARGTRKPLLIWSMNGHPEGFT
jgi:hypothetical protein